ncbi:unnamed protein product, partial [Laminaria digitata]
MPIYPRTKRELALLFAQKERKQRATLRELYAAADAEFVTEIAAKRIECARILAADQGRGGASSTATTAAADAAVATAEEAVEAISGNHTPNATKALLAARHGGGSGADGERLLGTKSTKDNARDN